MLHTIKRSCQLLSRSSFSCNHLRSLAYTAEAKNHVVACWNCSKRTSCCSFFCKGCGVIQPITETGKHCNHFELLQTPKNFNVELRRMEQTYWNLQKRLHPDLYGTKSKLEQEISATNAMVVNNAYNILKTPHTRVKYLLELHGIDALSETTRDAVDPMVLMRTMEIREEIEAAKSIGDLQSIREQVGSEIDNVIDKLSSEYDTKKNLEATRMLAVELQYLIKCAEEVDEKYQQLDMD